MSNFIELKSVCKSFTIGEQKLDTISNLDLSIKKGEVVTLLGVSGTGKSTLLNLIGGLDRVNSGAIDVDGVDVTKLDEKELTSYRRDNIGFIFQFYNLIPSFTSKENVLTALEAKGNYSKDDEKRVEELLESVGLKDKINKFPEQLSGGEQQRVAIARALIKLPPLILADEPTGNLDPETGMLVFDVLIEQAARTNATVLIVTHNPEIGEKTDRVIRLKAGHTTSVEHAS